MKKTVIWKATAFLMSLCMAAGMVPFEAHAAGQARSVNLMKDGKVDGIGDPASSDTKSWSGSKVYFGSYGSKQLLWRVLDSQVEAVTDKKVMLLQADSYIDTMAFDSDSASFKDSDLSAYLNGSDKFLKGFGKAEKDSIYKYNKKAGSDTKTDEGTFTNPALKDQPVFLLSAEEVLNKNYGYPGNDSRKVVSSGDSGSGSWWLRSSVKGEDTQAAVVDKNGKVAGQSVVTGEGESKTKTTSGVVPALYLDTSKVLFTTPADQEKPGKLEAVGTADGKRGWKLTLQSSDTSLSAYVENGSTFERGGVIELKHNAASQLPGATQVSAMILDNSGSVIYYGKINGKDATSSQITIPSDMAAGSYQLYVFAEDINGKKETDYASAMGNAIDFTVSSLLTPKIVTLPGASPITFGQKLSESQIQGGEVKADGQVIPGTFSWKDGSVMPSVADSTVTKYEVVFTPEDTQKYNPVTEFITIRVNKAQIASVPASSITVEYGVTKVSQVPLNVEGWSWRAADAGKDLVAGGVVQAIAVYKDTQNYSNYEVTVNITRANCTHTGGTATCSKQAVCDICKQPYGALDPSRHGATELRNVKAATCTEKGYTGDICCKDCGQILTKGQEIAELGHNYTSQVTKEPTDTEDGIRTYTCTRCGSQYTENMGKHTHYYNNVKTLKWVGCVQQGEVEYSCGCGDSYVEITPALGHDFKVEVTTKATADKAGVKTYTCTRCGYSYTEAIPKLGGSGSGEGSGSGAGGQGSGGSSSTDRKPYIKGNSSISGWTAIDKYIGKAADGDTVNINMNDSMILPGKTLKNLKGKNVTIVLDMGNDIKWSVSGQNITADNLADLNLKVTKNGTLIPSDKVEALAGERKTMQLSLAQEGAFGITMDLGLLVDSTKAGYYANLFSYNKESSELVYEQSVQMDGKGSAVLPLTESKEYVIVLDTAVMDGSQTPPEETISTEPSETLPEETVPTDTEASSSQVKGGISATVIIIIGLIVLGVGLLLIVLLRARNKHDDEYFEEE